jgi:hypothetical protein
MKVLSGVMLGVFLCSCSNHLLFSEWRAFEFTDLNTKISILTLCMVTDCNVVVKNQSGILFEDARHRTPGFAVGLRSKEAYGVIVCDGTFDGLFLFWNRVTNAKLSKIEVERLIEITLIQIGKKTATSMPVNQLICSDISVESEELRKQMTRIANSSGIISLR